MNTLEPTQNSLNLKKFLKTKRIKTHYHKTNGLFARDLETLMIYNEAVIIECK